MLRFWFFLALASSLAHAAPQSYYFPMQFGMREATAPVRPWSAPRQILVWNQFDEGQFGARLIEFEEQGDRFRRVSDKRVSTITGWKTNNDQERCDQLLANSVMKRIDNTSFHDMGAIDYFPDDPGAYDRHIESSHGYPPNALVYLETTSWLGAREARELFGGKIPWDRVVEIRAEPGFSRDELVAHIESGKENSPLRLRRGTLRLVSGQFLSWDVASPGQAFHFSHSQLPLESEIAGANIDRGTTPFVFELGRASQMRGLNGEAEILVPVAAAIMRHTTELFHPFPSRWEPMPPETVGIHVLSLNRAHTVLFRRRLGMRVMKEAEDKALLFTRLDELVEKEKPSGRLASTAAILAAVPGRYSELGALGLLAAYRQTFRRDWDYGAFTSQSPLVFRDYSGLRDYSLHTIIAPSCRPIAEEDFLKLKAALDAQGDVHAPHSFVGYQEDFGDQDWKALYGLSPLVVSNLDPAWAAKDPDYMAKVLLAISARWHPGRIPQAILDQTQLLLATRSESIAAAAQALGMKRLPSKGLGIALTLPLGEISKIAARYPVLAKPILENDPLGPGFWDRYRRLSDLPGL